MKVTGAKALIESLKREEVEVIFGYPGGSVLPIYDELYGSDIRHILVRHEQGCAHMADGYARVSGKVGVCLATSGPGATNLTTGIANAYMDSIPMVAITGQVATNMIGTDAFQEADITGITMPVVKHSYLVKDASELPGVVKEAFHLASSGRPGPVLIDIPVDVAKAVIEFRSPDRFCLPGYKPTYKGHPRQIKAAADLIREAKRPVIYAGGGAMRSGAHKEITELARLCNIPVATTIMGLGIFPETHRLSLGMLGMHGTWYANTAISRSDLVIAIGVRFDDRVVGKLGTFAEQARIIHIDIDPAEIGKNVTPYVPIVGNVRDVVGALVGRLNGKSGNGKRPRPPRKRWLSQIEEWKKSCPLSYKNGGNSLKPQYVVEKLYELTKGQAIITTDVGQNQMWAAQYYKYTRPNSFVSSCGLGTMGFGLPSAIGAKVARPDDLVFAVSGDGSFQMTFQELAVAASEKIPVKVAILNNGYLGMVRQWQQLFYDRRYSYTDLKKSGCPDFVKLADAYGIPAARVVKSAEVVPALKKAIQSDSPYVIDFVVEPEENVFPMVPPGCPISEMMLEEGK
jgi:acetolactate synthase-1/2/3 large subunit